MDAPRIAYAGLANLASWMELMGVMRENFPGLETQAALEEYEKTVMKNIARKSAVCALDGDRVVGLILFSVNQNRLSQLAVHPDYRRRGIASQMIALMLEKLDRRRDIVVTTFREGDEKGRAARALYSRLGFRPGNLGYSMDYPVQDFILPAAMRAD